MQTENPTYRPKGGESLKDVKKRVLIFLITPIVSRNTKLSKDKREFYHIGIIDYLQAWNFQKRGEAWLKTNIKGKNKWQLSAVEPIYYQKRFYDFIKNKVLLENSGKKIDFIHTLCELDHKKKKGCQHKHDEEEGHTHSNK